MNLWGFFISNGLFSKLLDSLFFLQRTNQQLSILLGNDIAIQALDYHLAFIGCMDHTVLAFIQADIITKLGIANLIICKHDDTFFSLSDSLGTSRRVSSHHPRSLPYESSRGYGAYLQR